MLGITPIAHALTALKAWPGFWAIFFGTQLTLA